MARKDITLKYKHKLFLQWLLGNNSLTEIAKSVNKNERTLRRWFKEEENKLDPHLLLPSFFNKTQPVSGSALILDGVYLGLKAVVLIARDMHKVVGYQITERENYASWLDFINQLNRNINISTIKVLVIDGKKGLTQAIKKIFNDNIKIQRCLFHIQILSRVYLTLRPKTEAGSSLKTLIHRLMSVQTKEERNRWLLDFFFWFVNYSDFLREKTYHPFKETSTGRRVWYYSHKRLRSAFNLVKHSLPYLFNFLDFKDVPKTTNHLEGGINARLKELIHRHRGLSVSKQKLLIALFLQSKME